MTKFVYTFSNCIAKVNNKTLKRKGFILLVTPLLLSFGCGMELSYSKKTPGEEVRIVINGKDKKDFHRKNKKFIWKKNFLIQDLKGRGEND